MFLEEMFDQAVEQFKQACSLPMLTPKLEKWIEFLDQSIFFYF